MLQTTEKSTSWNRASLSLLLLLIAGLFLSLSSNHAASYHWVSDSNPPSIPPPNTSGWLTIPDVYATPGDHLLPPGVVSGSWEDPDGTVYTPDPGSPFGIEVADNILREGIQLDFSVSSNFWDGGARGSIHTAASQAETYAFVGSHIFLGLWELDSNVPDGGSTLLYLLAGLSALGIAGRHGRLVIWGY